MRWIRMALCFLGLVPAALTIAAAQSYITLDLKGSVKSVGGQAPNCGVEISAGEEFSGVVNYRLDQPDEDHQSHHGKYLFDDERSGMFFQIGDVSFQSRQGRGTISEPGFLITTRYQSDQNYAQVSFLSANNLITGLDVASNNRMFFNLFVGQEDLIWQDALPPNIDKLLDAERIEVGIEWFEGASTANCFVSVSITEISIRKGEQGIVSGDIYYDLDGNCAFSDVDHQLVNHVVKFEPGKFFALTDSEGRFQVSLPYDTYTLSLVPRPLWETACIATPPGTLTSTIDETNTSSEANDFALRARENVMALNLSVGSSVARPGFDMTYTILYTNAGTQPYNGKLRFVHDNLLGEFRSVPEAESYLAPMAEWRLQDVPVGFQGKIVVTLKVPADERLLGQTICALAEHDADGNNDQLLDDSADELCQEIRGSYDPNDIQVVPAGDVTPLTPRLKYLIRFQNTGNEAAIIVRVRDTIDTELLDLSRLQMGAVSHSYTMRLLEPNVVEWYFANINLPDSTRDEAGSHGFIKFAIPLHDQLPIGSEIRNRAAIYFDYNRPVITNTVSTRLVSASTDVREQGEDFGVEVYPNPARDIVTLRSAEAELLSVQVVNSLGQIVADRSLNGANGRLQLASLPAGVYWLRIRTSAGELIRLQRILR